MDVLFFLILLVPAVFACPKDVMQGVRQCMNPMEPYAVSDDEDMTRQGAVFMFMSSLEKTSRLCSEGKIQDAFSCLNRLYNLCASTKEGARHFDLLVDVGKWRQAMDQICDNIHYLKEHEECEEQALAEFQPCVEEKVYYFKQRMAALDSQMSHHVHQAQRIEAVMELGCSFTRDIKECLSTPYSKYCPEHMTNLLIDVIQKFMPPTCVMMGGPIPHEDYGDDEDEYNTDLTHTDVVIGGDREDPSGDKDEPEEVPEENESKVHTNPSYRLNQPNVAGSRGSEGVVGAVHSADEDKPDNGQGQIKIDKATLSLIVAFGVFSFRRLLSVRLL